MAREQKSPISTAPAVGRTRRSQSRELASTAPASDAIGTRPNTRRQRQQIAEDDLKTGANNRVLRNATKLAPIEDLSIIDERNGQPSPIQGVSSENYQEAPTSVAKSTLEIAQQHVPDSAANTEIHDATSYSLDRDLVLAELPELYSVALKLLSIVVPQTGDHAVATLLLEEFSKPQSKRLALFQRRAKAYLLEREVFTDSREGTYIRCAEVIRAVLGFDESSSNLSLQLTRIINVANLGELIIWLIAIATKAPLAAQSELLELNDASFPLPFFDSLPGANGAPANNTSAAGSRELLDLTFTLALELRTQLALSKMISSPESARQVAIEVFTIPGDSGEIAIRGWAPASFMGSGDSASLERQARLRERLDQLLETSSDPAMLKASFPWSSFVAHALTWTNARSQEAAAAIASDGGVEALVTSLNQPPQAIAQNKPVLQAKGKAKGKKIERKRLLSNTQISAAAYLRENLRGPRTEPAAEKEDVAISENPEPPTRENANGSNSGPAVLSETGQEVSATEVPVSEVEHEQQTGTSPASQAMINAKKRLNQLAAMDARNSDAASQPPPLMKSVFSKAKSFIDHQAKAQRVEWSSQPTQALGRSVLDVENTVPAKRDHKVVEFDELVSDDEGFTNDRRNVNAEARRQALATKAPIYSPVDDLRSSPKRLKKSPEHVATSSASLRSLPAQARPRGAEEDVEDEDSIGDPSSPRPTYQTIHQMSRQLSALNNKPPQSRVAWTPTEENALLKYIETQGTSWALIKSVDSEAKGGPGILNGRNQVALKDKARNMRYDFEKMRIPLPRNFDRVTLNATQRRKLATLEP